MLTSKPSVLCPAALPSLFEFAASPAADNVMQNHQRRKLGTLTQAFTYSYR